MGGDVLQCGAARPPLLPGAGRVGWARTRTRVLPGWWWAGGCFWGGGGLCVCLGVLPLPCASRGGCCPPRPLRPRAWRGAMSPAPSSPSEGGILPGGCARTSGSERILASPPCPAPEAPHWAGVCPSVRPSIHPSQLLFLDRQQNSLLLMEGSRPGLTRKYFPVGSPPGLPAQVGPFPIGALGLHPVFFRGETVIRCVRHMPQLLRLGCVTEESACS